MSDDETTLRDDDAAGSSAEVEIALILEGYLSDLEAGRPADPDRLIAENPHLAGPLRACLEVMGLPRGYPGHREAGVSAKKPSNGSAARRSPDLSTFHWGSDDSLPRVQLSEPAGDEFAPVLSRPGLPVQAGRYQILGEIARGGMGAVLRARDADLGRELALKVLLRPHRDNADLRNRFVEEAQIGGQLQHPGIVPVYELGAFPDRRPFVAMKLVRGRTLAALLAERPVPTHDLPRFLAIFEQVCQTVAYAHARRVIHRDLKPSNVMVGSFGEVQVMDWGLAKVLKEGGVADERKRPDIAEDVTQVRTLRTEGSVSESQAGSVLGTPAYMAPEQARGEIDRVDERADVFGLGAILCEILSGRPPYLGSTRGEVQAHAARADLADALARLEARGADEELSRLARDCMAARPSDRPRDAGAVARRVTAYTAGVQERLRAAELARAEAQARASEERKRRRLAVGLAAALVGLVVTLGGGGAWWAYDRQARAARLDSALRGVEVLFVEAERAGDDPSKWSAARESVKHLAPLLDEARDAATRSRASGLIGAVDRGAIAAAADRALIDELVTIRASVDESPDQADARYVEAFRGRGIDPDGPSPEVAGRAIARRPSRVALALASSLDAWAAVRLKMGEREGAGRVLAVTHHADPDRWRNRLRLAMAEPNPTARQESVRRLAREAVDDVQPVSAHLLGAALLEVGNATEAEVVLRQARDRQPGDVWLNVNLARTLDQLGRSEEAIRYYMAAHASRPEAALQLANALRNKGETNRAIDVLRDLTRRRPDISTPLVSLASALRSQGRTRDADEVLERATAVARRTSRLKPDDASARLDLGNALYSQGDLEGAVAGYREAIRLKPDLASAYVNLTNALQVQGKLAEAVAAGREAIRLKPDDASAHNNFGIALQAKGDLDGAVAEYRQAIRLGPALSLPHVNLGSALHDKGDFDAAVASYRDAIRLKPDAALAYYNLGVALQAKGDLDGAVASYREAIRLKPDDADGHSNLGEALRVQRKLGESVASYREAIRLKPDHAQAHLGLGAILCDEQRDFAAAEAEFREAIRLKPDLAMAQLNLGVALHKKGDVDGAIDAWHRARDRAASDPNLLRKVVSLLAGAERAKRRAARLPAVLRGDDRPGDAVEQLAFAAMCYDKRHHVAAALLYADALSANPALADDRRAQHPYNAACAAALAGCGKGEDKPAPDEAARVKLRGQALDWLKAELVAWTRVMDRDASAAQAVAQTLQHWQKDTDLAGVREAEALAGLPEEERSAWRALWADVEALLKRALGESR